ncbi:MAG: hypothetical protein ACD_15C00003G0008 [uncultured bacterium]|nr:MAG: hypothetical protein ACD_15C00003G0008 [uncultured bacterium]
MKKQRIIAILGLPGSGKSVAINHIMKKYDWTKIYFGEVTFEEMKRLGLKINEKNERMIREGLRKKFGELCYVKRVAEKILRLDQTPIILLESLYSWTEYLFLKNKFGENLKTIAIYASPKKRYVRLKNRKIRPLNFEEARSRDYSQIENLSQAGPIAMADYLLINEGSKKELYSKIDGMIKNDLHIV